ncbi:DUF538 family protein (Protein of unknown function, DUF538) [Wolffia australiana]|uniref:Uncharacterized protein n=1 Tax=Wolffia australiana TaxID=161112 RepID=H6UGX1_WOLAU|nr:hypothetical protein [Wolffia australiana]
MAMRESKIAFFILVFVHILCLPSNSHSLAEIPNLGKLSAHELLRIHGFPPGLVPNNVQGYSLDAVTGEFVLNLGDNCRVNLPPDNYLASFSKKLTGKLQNGQIADLDGIRVRAFFRWWSITGIRSSGDDLVFEVGVASAKYPSKNFNVSLECEGRKVA